MSIVLGLENCDDEITTKYENCFKSSGINKIIFWDKDGERKFSLFFY